jgi:hypothetical protein
MSVRQEYAESQVETLRSTGQNRYNCSVLACRSIHYSINALLKNCVMLRCTTLRAAIRYAALCCAALRCEACVS